MAEASPEVKSKGGGLTFSPSDGQTPRNGSSGLNNKDINVGATSMRVASNAGENMRNASTTNSASTLSAGNSSSFGVAASTTAPGIHGSASGEGATCNSFVGATSNVSSSNQGASSAVKDKENAKSSGNASPRSPKHPRRMRVKLTEQQLETATREELAAKWRDQDLYVECLEAQVAAQEGEIACLRDSEEKYRQQCCEISHRERILVRRLASKEQQLLGYVNQLTEMRAVQTPSASALRSALLDPAVNILIKKLRQELLSTKAKLEDTQNELSAWKFTPDSNTGKRLMAKCRLLYQENEELGRMIASGRIAKLEGELALQKSFSEEVKKSQSELDEFLQDLDEDVEGMQSTIYFLQQELRKARESVSLLQQENNAFKSATSTSSSTSSFPGVGQPPQPQNTPQPPPPPPPPPQTDPPPPPPPPTATTSTTTTTPQPTTDNNLSNGLSSSSVVSIKTEESTKDSSEKVVDSHEKTEKKIDTTSDYRSVDSSARTPPPISRCPALSTSSTTAATQSEISNENDQKSSPTRSQRRADEADDSSNDSAALIIKFRPDEADDSSNDSAALIIKVDNEELSDREDYEEKKDAAPSVATPAPTTQLESCETRRPQRLSTRTKDKSSTTTSTTTSTSTTTTKNESCVVGKSNGDEKITSRTSTRRLLRDRTAKRDKSAVAAADSDDERRQHKKQKRRESILSIDYNETEDDALLITNGESIQSDPDD